MGGSRLYGLALAASQLRLAHGAVGSGSSDTGSVEGHSTATAHVRVGVVLVCSLSLRVYIRIRLGGDRNQS